MCNTEEHVLSHDCIITGAVSEREARQEPIRGTASWNLRVTLHDELRSPWGDTYTAREVAVSHRRYIVSLSLSLGGTPRYKPKIVRITARS